MDEQERDEVERRMSNVIVARQKIVEATEGRRGVSGNIECPICDDGTLQYSVSGYNGHIHAVCTSEDCVSWIE